MYSGISYHGILVEHAFYIPLHLEYRCNFSRKFQLFFYGGIGSDFGLRAKVKPDNDKLSYDDNNAYKNSIWKRVNLSYEFGGGICMKHVQFNFTMSKGIIDMSNNANYTIKQDKNIMTSISFMY